MLDDQPVVLKTRTKPIVNIPYTQECNDVAMMLIQHHKATEYHDRAMDQFEQLYHDSANSARVMALVVHPYIMGAPHRAKHFRRILEKISRLPDVVFWTGEQIHDWYLEPAARRPESGTESWRASISPVLNGLTFAALLFIVASGFTLIFGLLRIVNLAHGALYLFGGYIGLYRRRR